MAEAVVVQPDVRFIEGLIASGGADIKKCFQCATCTSVCALSDDTFGFPRRQMIKAQWGLKESLLSDPGIWLCHDCGDCTVQCPRGAKPGEVMGAIRAEAVKHYAVPRFAGRVVSRPAFLALLLALPFLVLGSVALEELSHGLVRPYVYAELFPQHVVDAIFGVLAFLVCLSFAWGASRLISDLRRGGLGGSVFKGFLHSLAEICTHWRFSKCSAERNRYFSHFFTLAGFVSLAIVTTAEAVGINLHTMQTPLQLTDSWKLLANAGAVVIFAGLTIVLWGRIHDRTMRIATTYFDWFFLLTLMGAVVTGILSEILRLAQTASLMYPIYLLHLVLVFTLFLYAPYSKFAHAVYRTVAMAAAWEKGRQNSEVKEASLGSK
jgi:quinone-modifying oxidoreductase, subunit QmoC